MKTSFALLCAALCTLSASAAPSPGLTTVNPSDIADLRQVSEAQVSPNGKLAAYVVTTPVKAGMHKDAHIWLVPTDASAPARPFVYSALAADTAPRWSPDGQMLVFLSDRKNPLFDKESGPFHFSLAAATSTSHPDAVIRADAEKGADADADQGMQLWSISLAGGEAVPLTAVAGGIREFRWAHDGESIFFVRADQDDAAERERKKQKRDHILVNQDYKYSRLWVYNMAEHQARVLTNTNINVDAFDVSPDGTTLAARVSPTPRIDDFWRVSSIVLIDAATGQVARTIEEHAGYMRPRWSPDGQQLVFSHMLPDEATDTHLMQDLKTGKQRVFEDGYAGTVEQVSWGPDGKHVYAEGIHGAHTELIEGDNIGTTLRPVGAVNGLAGEVTISDDGKTLVFPVASMQSPNEVWSLVNGKARQLTDTNPQVKQWKLGTEREIEWKSTKDGRTIHGVLVLPPGYEAGHAYKTVVHIHGGPEEAWTTGWHGNWYDYAAMLSSHGYVVLLPNPRGSDGAGPAFTEANQRDWGGGDYQDIEDGLDTLIAQGIADKDRMVVGGWSFGGFMTSWTITHTDRFKAAMVGAGVTDLFTMATTTDIAPAYETSYFGPLSANKKLYDEHSPVRYLEQCHTPVLVLHGEADQRVPISQGEEFYYGLHFLGRETSFVRYPREPHIFTEREHQVDSLQRILDWYDHHLPQ